MAGDEVGGSRGRKGGCLDLVGCCNGLNFYSSEIGACAEF